MGNETMNPAATDAADTIATDSPPALRFLLDYGIVAALLIVAPKQEVRFYLCGACLDTTGANPVLVATDGHRLLIVRVHGLPHDMPRGQWIIPRDALASVKPAKMGRGSFVPFDVTITGDRVRIAGQTTAEAALVDGRYPDWRRIVPAKVSGEVAQFNGDYLADWSEVARKLSGSNVPHAVIGHNGTGAAHVNFPACSDAFGIIMPMRTDPMPAIKPEWVG